MTTYKTRLSITKARALLMREVGIGKFKLTMPPQMNQNPDFPFYELLIGTQRIEIYSAIDSNLIALSMQHENSGASITEYFYSDTLEYAAETTDYKLFEAKYENDESDSSQATRLRLERASNNAVWFHFHPHPDEHMQSESKNNNRGMELEK